MGTRREIGFYLPKISLHFEVKMGTDDIHSGKFLGQFFYFILKVKLIGIPFIN